MKLLILFFVLLNLHVEGLSQKKSLWGAFAYVLNARQYEGKKFRLEAAVKTALIDKAGHAGMWARVDKVNKKMGFFYNMSDKPIRDENWKVYSIAGKIDKGADKLVFGGIYYSKGFFYFDDFKLYIETTDGKMEEIDLINGGFERDSLSSGGGWGYNKQFNMYDLSLTREHSFSGKQAVQVDGSNIIAKKEYGNNDSVGNFANVNGIDIYYERYGKGAPLLLLHGNSSSISLYEKQIPEFSKYFQVIAVDTRGQGKSTDDGKKYTYDLFAQDMNALLNHLNLDSVNVVGWSDGGNTGLIMAMQYPNKIKKLVTMGANIFIDKSVVGNWVFKTLNSERQDLKTDTSYNSKNRLRLINLLLTEPNHSFEELRQIKCPVLVVAGEKDIIKEKHTISISESISNSTLYIAPKETHYFPSENPALFNKRVLEFFSN